MREVNFSIPSANRASVSITTALYDRRALDCTSTLPLINSLNHLCYLTTSSARIREILTIDGGVERLICILKNGRTQDMMETWKWNLAFHCVVNIGVRGSDGRGSDSSRSENIRTRVVEADVVPVIATILDNYQQVVQKTRHHMDHDVKRSRARLGSCRRRQEEEEAERTPRSSRREAPPPIAIPTGSPTSSFVQSHVQMGDRATSPRLHNSHRHHRRHVSLPGQMQQVNDEERLSIPGRNTPRTDNLAASDPTLLPPMTATSQPDTPVTPRPPTDVGEASDSTQDVSVARLIGRRRPSIRREVSTSGDSDDGQPNNIREDEDMEADIDANLNRLGEVRSLLERGTGQSTLEEATEPTETGQIPMNHPPIDGSIIDSTATPRPPMRMQPPLVVNSPVAPEATARMPGFTPRETWRTAGSQAVSSVPRDEDVIMSLQLLAYISKYCDLRTYFQQTHLVPRLKMTKRQLAEVDPSDNRHPFPTDSENIADDEVVDNDGEYEQEDNYNIFPLVEQFTVKFHSQEMKYWAGVVMRNLCRKDKSRGDIRQCAYYKCGKWEDYAKQFAKCRRCRQTKYCSKECQKRFVSSVIGLVAKMLTFRTAPGLSIGGGVAKQRRLDRAGTTLYFWSSFSKIPADVGSSVVHERIHTTSVSQSANNHNHTFLLRIFQ